MAQDSWPSPNHNSRNVTDPEYERIAARFSDDGVDGTPLDAAVVSAGTGLQVVVRSGVYASVRGFTWYSGSVDDTLTISANAAGSTRYDAVVLRLDRSTWDVRAVVVEGAAGSGVPTLTQDIGDTGAYEILLAYVTVPDGASSVTVSSRPQYIGSRIRPENDGSAHPNPDLGEISYRPNVGKWRGWNGSNWVSIYEDTGLLTIAPGFSTWNQIYNNVGQLRNGWVYLRVWVQRTGSTFSVNDPDGSKIGVVPSELVSAYNNFFPARFTGSGGNARVEVRGDTGEIWITENDSNVTVGRVLSLTMSYLKI
ncbi:hypothetical protein [Streptomyces sp. 891-h]|uniref:hypothetical protein n=1 Tax=Streptomyces sp. 891-h TaxID=2720714 RepID=UPI001FA9E66A|nr:hypothetical protein [Streptomyces sp. 891-h]UNZ20633.1 hypothetical protein HC362_29775 [Streptomyces sp. 891-h]